MNFGLDQKGGPRPKSNLVNAGFSSFGHLRSRLRTIGKIPNSKFQAILNARRIFKCKGICKSEQFILQICLTMVSSFLIITVIDDI